LTVLRPRNPTYITFLRDLRPIRIPCASAPVFTVVNQRANPSRDGDAKPPVSRGVVTINSIGTEIAGLPAQQAPRSARRAVKQCGRVRLASGIDPSRLPALVTSLSLTGQRKNVFSQYRQDHVQRAHGASRTDRLRTAVFSLDRRSGNTDSFRRLPRPLWRAPTLSNPRSAPLHLVGRSITGF
jgi:hypothetical protein